MPYLFLLWIDEKITQGRFKTCMTHFFQVQVTTIPDMPWEYFTKAKKL